MAKPSSLELIIHYCRYLVGDTHTLFFLFVFLFEKSSGFVIKEILITQT